MTVFLRRATQSGYYIVPCPECHQALELRPNEVKNLGQKYRCGICGKAEFTLWEQSKMSSKRWLRQLFVIPNDIPWDMWDEKELSRTPEIKNVNHPDTEHRSNGCVGCRWSQRVKAEYICIKGLISKSEILNADAGVSCPKHENIGLRGRR